MDFIDKLTLIILKDKKVLYTRSFNKDRWYTPGGKREGDETDEQALVRELKEELGVDVVPSTVKYYGTFQAQAHGKPEGVMVRITCYTGEYEGEAKASSEIEEIRYFSYADREIASLTGQLILDDLHQKGLIE